MMLLQIKEGLGGRIRLMLAGAAPLPRHVEEFMRVTSGSVLVQGYGMIYCYGWPGEPLNPEP